MLGLELMGILVCILLLHHLESRHIEIREMFAVVAREAILLCHGCVADEMEELAAEEPDSGKEDDGVLYYSVNDSALANGTFVDPGSTAPLLHHSIPTLAMCVGGPRYPELRHHILLPSTRHSCSMSMMTDPSFPVESEV